MRGQGVRQNMNEIRNELLWFDGFSKITMISYSVVTHACASNTNIGDNFPLDLEWIFLYAYPLDKMMRSLFSVNRIHSRTHRGVYRRLLLLLLIFVLSSCWKNAVSVERTSIWWDQSQGKGTTIARSCYIRCQKMRHNIIKHPRSNVKCPTLWSSLLFGG